MRRRQKIIISVTGIFLVLLILVGLTYAYFLTQIQGNEEERSISATTANIELLFDNSTSIINANSLMPIYEDDIKTKATKKTFTIDTLESTVTQYITIKLTDLVIDEELANNDFKWALYENGEWITKYSFENITTGQDIELISNLKLDINTTKTYDLYIYIEETGQDQSDMMGKKFSAKISVEGYLKPVIAQHENLLSTLELVSEEYVSPANGIFSSSANVHKLHSHTDYINVDDSKVLYFSGEYNDSSLSIVFYDENKTFISGIQKSNNMSNYKVYDFNGIKYSGELVEIPKNAEYFIINVITSYYTTEDRTVYHYYLMDKNITKEYNLPLDYESTTTLSGISMVNFGDSIFGNRIAPDDISTHLNTYYGATTYNAAVGGTRMSAHTSQNYDAFSMYNLADAITSNDYSLQESNVSSLANSAQNHFTTLKSIDFSTVDYITIALGTNDFTANTIISNDNNLDTTTYIGAARYSINKIKEAYPNIKIVLLTPIYRWWKDGTDVDSKTNNNNQYLIDYVNALKELKNEYDNNVYLYDGYNDVGIDITTRNIYFYSNDGTHPNITGLKLYAYKLGKFIEKLENE